MKSILEASLVELLDQKAPYAKTLSLYLQARVGELTEHCRELDLAQAPAREDRLVSLFSRLRLQVRMGAVDLSLVQKLQEELSGGPNLSAEWIGEAHFVLALAAETFLQFDQARIHYEKAADCFERAEVTKKAIKSGFNALAMKTRLKPDGFYLVEYHRFIQKAKKARLSAVVGTAFGNVSREYQRMGALRAACRFAGLAVGYLRRHDFGGYDYYLALVHRADLRLLEGQREAALLDLDEASVSPLIEVRGAIAVVRARHFLAGSEQIPDEKLLPPTWEERRREPLQADSGQRFSQLESDLLRHLGRAPKSRVELMAALYPGESDTLVLENRLKNLLGRIRKKNPELIGWSEGRYFIMDPAFKLKVDAG